MSADITHWPWTKLVLFAASVFAVAAITALVLTLAQNLPGLPGLSNLFPSSAPAQLTDEDKMNMLVALTQSASTTPNIEVSEKKDTLKSLGGTPSAKKETPAQQDAATQQKLDILSKLNAKPVNPQ